MSHSQHYTAATAMLVCGGLWCTAGFGQTAGGEDHSDGETGSGMDEIVVTAQKPGDRQGLDTPYGKLLRKRLLRQLEAQRELEEEFAWRRGTRVEEPSRIRLGYRPQDANRDRHDTALTDLPMENHKPATLFRFEF